ncbi:MAG: Asp23/Gls24 family envelope stress response protein [Actinomycetota bacterium]|nr:Asp23/Gls24 family envelope stress response protein [Actinomycetota bacterium]HZY64657.1 Asp23/Gls24 family envelope stress response protein [Rubrobacteraceae bacterium]
MSEQGGQQKGRKGQQSGGSPLKTDRGQTSIQDGVVAKIAGIAAQEVEGIRMGGGASQAASGIMSSLTGGGGGGQTRGVAVEVGEEEAAVDLTMTTEYGKSIPQLSEAVRRNVVNRIENLVGLSVTEVNITVSNIFFPQEEQGQQQLEGE